MSYDPAFAYELAVIIQDGIRRMYKEQESVFYYLTVMNEQYPMPAMPEGAREGILKGLYRCKPADERQAPSCKAQLLGSGAILNEVLAAQKLLEKYGVAADVWSVTSYQELYRDAHARGALEHAPPGRDARRCRTSRSASRTRRASSSRPPTT